MKIGSLSGSLQQTVGGTPFIVAGSNISITSGSNGSLTLSSTGGAATGSLTTFYIPDYGSWSDTGVDLGAYFGPIFRIGTKLYLFGGYTSGNVATNKIYSASYDASGITPAWSDTGATMPSSTPCMRIALIGSTLYMFGGLDNFSTIYSASLATPLSWASTGASIDTRRDNASIVIASGTIMLFGGWYGVAGRSDAGYASVATPTTWSTSASVLAGALWEHGSATIGNNVIHVGGQGNTTTVQKGSVNRTQPSVPSYATNMFGSVTTMPAVFHNGTHVAIVGCGSTSVMIGQAGRELSQWETMLAVTPVTFQYPGGSTWIGGDGRAYFVKSDTTGRIYRSGRVAVYVPDATLNANSNPYAGLAGYLEDGTPAMVSSHVRMGVAPWITYTTGSF